MRFGVSTACLFPVETSASLVLLQKQSINTVEIFLNSFCELEPDYIDKLFNIVNSNKIFVSSIHPFTSGMESFFFASAYKTRFTDGLELYKKYFNACKMLGAPRLVFHGDYINTPFPFQQHCEHYSRLRNIAREYNVELCYENVVRCKCGTPDNIMLLREYTNDDVSFVLDIKQMRRSNVAAKAMLSAMKGKISLIHASDCSDGNDCILPAHGSFDFNLFFKALKNDGFCGDIILELYENGYKTVKQLSDAALQLKALYENEDGALT